MVALRVIAEDDAGGVTAPVRQTPALTDDTRAILNHLRLVSLRCRAAARQDLFHACAMLSLDRATAKDAHAVALMRGLSQALGKAPKMYRPGVDEVSFDEAWLLRMAEAAMRDDDGSLLFLIHSRVPVHMRRSVAFLIRAVVDRFGRT